MGEMNHEIIAALRSSCIDDVYNMRAPKGFIIISTSHCMQSTGGMGVYISSVYTCSRMIVYVFLINLNMNDSSLSYRSHDHYPQHNTIYLSI